MPTLVLGTQGALVNQLEDPAAGGADAIAEGNQTTQPTLAFAVSSIH